MAISFNTPPAGTTLNANTALDNLRNFLMVDRRTGAAVDRDRTTQRAAIQAVFGITDVATQDSPFILVTNRLNNITSGVYNITDRHIVLNSTDAALLASNNGVHISFYNCAISIVEYDNTNSFITWPFAASTNAGGNGGRNISARVTDALTATRSINFFGCTINVGTNGQREQMRLQLSDAIGTDLYVGGKDNDGGATQGLGYFIAPTEGCRWIDFNITVSQNEAESAVIITYGFFDVFERVRIYGPALDIGQAGSITGPKLLLEPDFALFGQPSAYVLQATARTGFNLDGNIYQSLGFFSPPDNNNNDDNDVLNTGGNGGYVNRQNGGGGVQNFAGYNPTYTDVNGIGIRNVRVRVNTSVQRGNPGTATTGTSFDNIIGRLDQNYVINATSIGNQYSTDANGRLVTDMYTTDGWSTSEVGRFDPFDFNFKTAQGQSVLANNELVTPNLTAPVGVAPAMLQDISFAGTTPRFARHVAQYQAFSFSHDILVDQEESSQNLIANRGAAGAARAASTVYGLNTAVSRIAGDLRGQRVKETYVNADLTPNITAIEGAFTAGTTASINDVRNAYRERRYAYAVFGNPELDNLEITVDNSLADPYTATQGTISIRANGLAAAVDDLFTADTDITSLNMNGNPISNLTLGTTGATTFTNLRKNETAAAAAGGALSGSYSTDAGDIFFDGVNVSGLDLTVTSGTLRIFGNDQNGNRLSNASFNSVTGTTEFPTPVLTFAVTPIATATTGFWAVKSSAIGDFTDAQDVTGQNPQALDGNQTLSVESTDTNVYRIYLKQATTFGVGNRGYYIRIVDVTADSTKSAAVGGVPRTVLTADFVIDNAAAEIPNVFITGRAAPPTGATDPVVMVVNSTRESATLDVSHANLDDAPGGAATQALYLNMANSEDWFHWHWDQTRTVDQVAFAANNVTSFNTDVRMVSASGAQQSVNQLNPPFSVRRGGVSPNLFNEVISFIDGTATIGQVTDAARLGIDSSTQITGLTTQVTNVAADVVDVRNGVGYQLSTGTNATTTADARLAGIRPKQAEFDDTNDYTGIFNQ